MFLNEYFKQSKIVFLTHYYVVDSWSLCFFRLFSIKTFIYMIWFSKLIKFQYFELIFLSVLPDEPVRLHAVLVAAQHYIYSCRQLFSLAQDAFKRAMPPANSTSSRCRPLLDAALELGLQVTAISFSMDLIFMVHRNSFARTRSGPTKFELSIRSMIRVGSLWS